jgi:fructose-bisphosphate aldolase class II
LPGAWQIFTNYDGVLKADGEVGDKKANDTRSCLKRAEASMSERVVEACNDLRSAGRSVTAS